MYATIRRYKTKAGTQLARRVQEGFLPIISKVPGFVGYYAIDCEGGEWMTVSLFETQEAAAQSNWLAQEWIEAHVASLVEGPPEITAGTVVVRRVNREWHMPMPAVDDVYANVRLTA